MDTTFITIHDLSDDAHILYSSDSIVDILGHTPDEVVNRSVWHFFHPEELPLAREQHSRGVRLDKAAVLSYCRLRNRQGDWVGCECCFSVVYDVLVCCTSIYRHGMQSQKRAVEAPIVRKLFASSPKDPRYHMLSHLSSKFDLGPEEQTHEPRAALFLNRFTRTLTVMYATSGIEQIIGISGEAMKGKSFYYCIAPNCLEDAVRCLESAKGNDSIAYMRFFFRDPRDEGPEPTSSEAESEDDIMTDVTGSDDESEGGVDLGHPPTTDGTSSSRQPSNSNHRAADSEEPFATRENSGERNNRAGTHRAMFGGSAARSDISSVSTPRSEFRDEPIELEAVISCTSDGLVVCLRRARPMLPGTIPMDQPTQQYNGIFAAPWATQPIFHPAPQQMPQYPLGARHPAMVQAGPSLDFQNSFMQSIRDVAVFAWALTGINGSLVDYARGKPVGESQPPEGFPVWNPLPSPASFSKQHSAAPSGYVSGSNSSSSNDPFGFGDPGLR
ncbi:pas domain-containing [Pyrenophora seminiperda CCB06]|uniref:Pas domain-containing n=1 Tax=Pyrenophora seminiperda CCB06 TaxID=1302712 RepID=A0A3M7MG52_9PLEO|nr:pas domain-containing [Pyrenophora seminiperda CCB06]